MASLCHSLFGAELILVKLGLLQTFEIGVLKWENNFWNLQNWVLIFFVKVRGGALQPKEE